MISKKIQSKQVYEGVNPNVEAYCHPKLFPYRRLHWKYPRQIRLTRRAYVKLQLKQYSRKFRRDIPWVLYQN